MVLAVPLAAVQEDYLIRDRIACDAEEMTALKDSLRARGQQSPIEVTYLGQGRYGLISGWRRLRALRELAQESDHRSRFATVQALLRQPHDRPAAYLAMVEENEIRADLSFYERARITCQAVREGVFDSDKHALQSLFSAVSFSKRSKIKSFIPLVEALDDVLRYPAQIPERLGLALSKALDQPELRLDLIAALKACDNMTAEEERAVLEQALLPKSQSTAPIKSDPVPAAKDDFSALQIAPGIHISARRGRVDLRGQGVTEALIADLTAWLRGQA